MVFQLSNPDIALVTDYCKDMLPGDKLEVFDFGLDMGLCLHIYAERENDPYPRLSKYDYWKIFSYANGELVDSTDEIENLEEVVEELNRIWLFGKDD